MGYEENISCDFCGAKVSAEKPRVPHGWVTVRQVRAIVPNPADGAFCGLTCASKFIAELLEEDSH